MAYPNNNLTYRNIIEEFETACSESLAVATFDTGTIDFLDANAVNKNYPYIYLRPVSSQGVVDRVKTLTFELYSMDIPSLQDQSPVRVLSETEQRIYDTIAWFNFGPAERQQVYEVTMTDLSPVNEAFQDRVFGWVATIDVTTPFNWNYCDYPKIFAVTPTPSPTPATPTPTPTASPTPTATPPGFTFTPTPTATATPTPTPTFTPTATPTQTPLPTLAPTPTPTPTPAPTYFEFRINDTNQTGSLAVACEFNTGSYEKVYVSWFDDDPAWPDRIVGKEVYSDPTLLNVYTGSAVSDDSVIRVAYGSESVAAAATYAGLELEWRQFSSSNQVLTVAECDYPVIDTLPGTPLTISSSLATGRVVDQAGRNFSQFGFEYSTGSTVPAMLEGNAVTSSYPTTIEFTSSIELALNSTSYYRAWAQDLETGVKYYGDIESMSVQPAYAWPVRWLDTAYEGPVTDLNTLIANRDDRMAAECGNAMSSAQTVYIAQTEQIPTGSTPYGCIVSGSAVTINDFIGSTIWNDKEMTVPESLQPNPTLNRYYAFESNIHGVDEVNDYIFVYSERSYPGQPDYDPSSPNAITKVRIVSGSLTCAGPNTCNP